MTAPEAGGGASAPAGEPPRQGRHLLVTLPLGLVHPVVLTFVAGSVFSYLTGDTVRAGYLMAVGRAHRRGTRGRGRVGGLERRWRACRAAWLAGGDRLVCSVGRRGRLGVTIAGFAAFALAGTALNVAAHRPGSPIPTMGAVFTRLMHSRTGRIAVVAWWAWLGLHVFAR